MLRYSIPKGNRRDDPGPRAARLPRKADYEARLTLHPINRAVLYPNTLDYDGRVLGLDIFHVDSKQSV